MPGFLLHIGAQVTCSHGGQAVPTVVSPAITVSGQPVATLGAPYTIVGCARCRRRRPPTAPVCRRSCTVGATRVFAGGLPVLLLSSPAICMPTGTPLLVLAAQPRVTGV